MWGTLPAKSRFTILNLALYTLLSTLQKVKHTYAKQSDISFTHDVCHNNLVILATVCGIKDQNSVPGRVDARFVFCPVQLILNNMVPGENYTALLSTVAVKNV